MIPKNIRPSRTTRRRLLRSGGAGMVALVAGCAGGGQQGNGETTTTTEMATTTEGTETTETTESVEPALSVSDQTVNDRMATISSLAIDEAGWVVIHPEAEGGGPNGKVTLATKQLEAGSYQDVSLTMRRVTVDGENVYAMLHYEDPDDGKFTFPQNGDPAVTKDGNPVIKPFTISLAGAPTPALSVTDQQTDGSTVSIPSAAIDESGWLVVHPEADGGGPNGKVTVAQRQIPAGLYAQLDLELTTTIAEDQTLYGMLHYEDPADGTFTFPQNGDPPVTKDGNPIVKPFEVTVSGDMQPKTKTSTSETASVSAVNTSFDPVRLSVDPGTTVEWTNEDYYPHDVTSAQFHDVAEDWSFSKQFDSDETISHTFDSAGVYEYYCTIHGKSTMCGAVIVGDASLNQDLPCERSM